MKVNRTLSRIRVSKVQVTTKRAVMDVQKDSMALNQTLAAGVVDVAYKNRLAPKERTRADRRLLAPDTRGLGQSGTEQDSEDSNDRRDDDATD